MYYDAEKGDHGLPYNPFKALVVPRPIGWISTLGADGVANLAPYSFFNAAAFDPPFVMFCSGGQNDERPHKDSAHNAETTGEFVVNVVGMAQAEKMNQSARWVAPDVDEFALVGLEKAASVAVRVPRVKDAPAHLECRHHQTVRLPSNTPGHDNLMIIGKVVGIHIDDAVINADGLVDPLRYNPVARMGYLDYLAVDTLINLEKVTERNEGPSRAGREAATPAA